MYTHTHEWFKFNPLRLNAFNVTTSMPWLLWCHVWLEFTLMMPSRAYLMRRGLLSSSTLRHCWGDQVCTTITRMETYWGVGGIWYIHLCWFVIHIGIILYTTVDLLFVICKSWEEWEAWYTIICTAVPAHLSYLYGKLLGGFIFFAVQNSTVPMHVMLHLPGSIPSSSFIRY